ncbi:Anaphase-promoting complex subunit 10 [Caenorhabditis elegans]|uniref:Anaphase-promoting complex subunit 10 n=1 Tax=Caenorhabditis elegans TaxID=6239 RepID=Q2WF61_CAEEL|nr:Anaphase-promoting complex subunit 10 [Caenorhabditis elegans]CCD71733.1 Anaphase-promoting complex subunit 10 [Caenorhabditis elegans]|eukprot:NP_001021777.1 Uncharacterized protein CELE_Y48G1C.12 [Caenorhabditis elegans]
MECDETKLSDGASGWVPSIPTDIDSKDTPLLDISSQAIWALSSCKSGFGIDELLSDSVEKYWQSDGPQPHTILLEFQKKTDVAMMMFYLDFKNDESYTPSKIQVKMGSSHQDIFFRQTQTFNEPQGWTFIDLRDKNGKPNRVFWLQVQVIQNHQNGRDTHIRHVRVLGPQRSRVSTTNRIFTGEPHGPIPDKNITNFDDEDFANFIDHSLVHLSLR